MAQLEPGSKFSVTETTFDIMVSVETGYLSAQSNPAAADYLFSYRIRIVNHSRFAVRLLRRHWLIYDSIGIDREVEGEGVVGRQPEIGPGATHTYDSVCNLKSEMGRMKGTYLMQRLVDGHAFRIRIPEFTLCTPSKLN